jgi:hypothetical protein
MTWEMWRRALLEKANLHIVLTDKQLNQTTPGWM